MWGSRPDKTEAQPSVKELAKPFPELVRRGLAGEARLVRGGPAAIRPGPPGADPSRTADTSRATRGGWASRPCRRVAAVAARHIPQQEYPAREVHRFPPRSL